MADAEDADPFDEAGPPHRPEPDNGADATEGPRDQENIVPPDEEEGDDGHPVPQLGTMTVDVPVFPGSTKTITILLSNTGSRGTVTVSAEGSVGWGATVEPDKLILEEGKSANLSVTITAPADGEAGDTATVLVEAIGESGARADTQVSAIIDHPYEQEVWFNWNTKRLDVLILGVEDPIVGNAIKEGINVWEIGIAQLAPEVWRNPGLLDDLEIRAYWPVMDGPPPTGFMPNILFVPQGFMALWPGFGPITCIATAPMVAGWGSMVHVAAHEFGHCLGLDHVFEHGVEYEPTFDIMGAGESGFRSCPSNLNLIVMERVFTGQSGNVQVASSAYYQAAC